MSRIYHLLWHLWLTVDFFCTARFWQLITKDPILRRQRFINNSCRIAKRYLRAFQITTKVFNPQRLDLMKEKSYLVVANHVSYLDIMVLSSLHPFVFITSVEMGANPFLGDITRLGGSLYTNRKTVVSLRSEIDKFAEAIKQGFNVVLFPEGTSTDGTDIRPFRSSLFETAIKAEADILPICIKYTTIDGEPRSDANRDLVCWYGDMTFGSHFMRLLGRTIEAEIHILEPITCTTQQRRQCLADETYKRLREVYLN